MFRSWVPEGVREVEPAAKYKHIQILKNVECQPRDAITGERTDATGRRTQASLGTRCQK